MQESHLSSGPAGTNDRRAQLVAAAEALRTWVHTRRDTWTDVPLETPAVKTARAPVHVPRAVAPAAAEPPVHVAPAPVTPVFEKPVVQPALHQAPFFDVPPDDAPGFEARTPPPSADLPVDPEPADGPANSWLPQGEPDGVPGEVENVAETAPAPNRRRMPRFSLPAIPIGPVLASVAGRWKPVVMTMSALALVVALGLSARTYLARRPAAPTTGNVLFETVPADSQVFLDGKPLGDTPLNAELAPGRHIVEFRRRKATRKVEIDVVAGGSTVGRVDWTAKRTGRLRVNSDPAGAKVTVDGKLRGITPLELSDVAIGSHAVVLETAKGSVRRAVTVAEEGTAEIAESIYSGWAHVSTPFEVTITEEGRALRLDERNQMLLSPGVHTLQFENKTLGYQQTYQVDVKPGGTSSIAVVPPLSSITVTSTTPAEVLLDGERVGETPITDRPIAIGTRDVIVRRAPGDERAISVTVTSKPARVDVDFSNP